MRFLLLSIVLFGFTSHAFGQNGESGSSSDSEHSEHGQEEHDEFPGQLECYHCVHTVGQQGYPGDINCRNPSEDKNVTIKRCPVNKACAYWTGNTSIGFTVIRGCSVYDTSAMNCKNGSIEATVELKDLQSSPLSTNDHMKVGNKTDHCAAPLCNSGSATRTCAGESHCCQHNITIPSQPSSKNVSHHSNHGGQHGGNGGMGKTGGAGVVYHSVFLLCSLLFLDISM